MKQVKVEFDGRNKEELQKYKAEILEKVAKVIEKGGPFLILGNVDNEQIVSMGGGGEAIIQMIASAMAKVNELRRIFEISTEAYEYAVEQVKEKSGDNPFSKIADKLGCHTCPTKESCDIYTSDLVQGKEPTMEEAMKLLEALHKKHPEMVGMMAKGGDA